ncbi:hypothetical protein DL771_008739 [Monosporascus sp. 5C6A]|nr:hypothetical protein DL771_008739 [Monosporascus sp. 5C6A]
MQNGWTNTEIGLKWLREVFIPNTKPEDPDEWRLLVIDGHNSHTTEDFMWMCLQNKIYIIFLPAHASHIFQPLDVGVFATLKRRFRYWFRERCYGRASEATDKTDFLWALSKAWGEVMMTSKYILKGWEATGLRPINKAKVLNNRDLARIKKNLVDVNPTFGNPTTRLLFRKFAKALDEKTNRLSAAEVHNSQLAAALEKAKPKKRKKVQPEPNEAFVTMISVKKVKVGLKAPAKGRSTVTRKNQQEDEPSESEEDSEDDPDCIVMFAAGTFSAMTLGLLVGSVPLGLREDAAWLWLGKVVPLLTISGNWAWPTWECWALLGVECILSGIWLLQIDCFVSGVLLLRSAAQKLATVVVWSVLIVMVVLCFNLPVLLTIWTLDLLFYLCHLLPGIMSVDVITIEDLRDLIRNLPATVQARQKHYRPGPYRGRPASSSLAPPFTSLGTASTAGSKRPRSGSSVSDLYFYDSYPVALFEAVVHSLPRPELVHKAVPETDIDGVGCTLAGLTFRRSNPETPLGKVQPLTIRILDNLLRHQDVKRDIEELLDVFDVRYLATHRNPSLDPQILQKLNDCKRNYDGELDEYKVYHMINKGTFGVVYSATKGDVDVAIKMVVHNEQYVFNDIKPEIFLVSGKKIHITNFGLTVSHPGLDMPRTRLNGSLPTGTARYMSVDAHVFKERYPKDDLEALGHVFVYFMGRLPWMGLKTEPALTRTQQQEEHLKILELKKKTTTEALCEGLQSEIGQYLAYARGLTPEEKPDYDFMRGLFQSGMESRGEADDGCFCWLPNEEPPRTRSRHR